MKFIWMRRSRIKKSLKSSQTSASPITLEQFGSNKNSLAISRIFKTNSFCWSFTKSGLYIVKSWYWVARHILMEQDDVSYTEPSITKLHAFAWKVNAPRKIHHLIWKLITSHVVVTRNLARRHRRWYLSVMWKTIWVCNSRDIWMFTGTTSMGSINNSITSEYFHWFQHIY